MPRSRTLYRCERCDAASPKWLGRCPACGAWSTLVEEAPIPDAPVPPMPERSVPAVPLAEVIASQGGRGVQPTGVDEVDRVLGGGLVPASVTLLGGVPGVGKSTLLLQIARGLGAAGRSVLYVTGEESPQQVAERADRLGRIPASVWIVGETALSAVRGQVATVAPEVLLVDSIQTLHDPEVASVPGSVAQVRACASALVEIAHDHDLPLVLTGHVTKDDVLAGPRVLEHLVDTVLSFEGDRRNGLRVLRALKHRHGATDDLGVFEMTARGLAEVEDPSTLFLADRLPGVAGSVVAATLEGHRPFLVEVQALATSSNLPAPRRSAQGLDAGRLAVTLAVLQRRVGLPLERLDVYALAVGGARVREPAADLAVALAVASAAADSPLPGDLVVCGEVGLGGELRQVGQLDRRLAEACRHGFGRALVPASCAGAAATGIEVVPARTLADALVSVGLVSP